MTRKDEYSIKEIPLGGLDSFKLFKTDQRRTILSSNFVDIKKENDKLKRGMKNAGEKR